MDVSIRSSTPHNSALESFSSTQLPLANRSDRYSTSIIDRVSTESNIGLLASAATATNHYIHAPIEEREQCTHSDLSLVECLSTSSTHSVRAPRLSPIQPQLPYTASKLSIHQEIPISKSPMISNEVSAFSTITNESKPLFRAATPNGSRMDGMSIQEKSFACDQCNQTFSRQHNLKSHYLTHTQERPYQCNICNQHFRRHHDLKRHSKLHTGERPYQCTQCERSFARLDALNRHLKAEREGGGGCSGVNRGSRNRSGSGEKEIGMEKNLSSNLRVQRVNISSDSSTVIPQTSKHQSNFVESPKQHSPSRDSNSPYYQQVDNPQPEDSASVNSNGYNPLVTKTTGPTSTNLQQPSPMTAKAQIQPYALSTEHLSRLYTSTGHHLTISPVQVQSPHFNYLPPPTPNSSQYQGIRIESHTGYSPENISSDPGYRDSSISSHSNDDATSPHTIQKAESNVGFCPSPEVAYLQEKNGYLEARVKELEADLIKERMMKRRREWLEERVRELEIEKSLLKGLLIEGEDYLSRVTSATTSNLPADLNLLNASKELTKKRRVI